MESNLEILIHHLEKEIESLRASRHDSVEGVDFKDGRAVQVALTLAINKLRVLKRLQNPLYDEIAKTNRQISKLKKTILEELLDKAILDESIEGFIAAHPKLDDLKALEFYKRELDAFNHEDRMDDDKILELLERLETDELTSVKFEIKKGKIYLIMNVTDNKAKIEFHADGKGGLNYYLHKQTRLILNKLGFDTETHSKEIDDYKKVDKLNLLQELAIIVYEVFGLYGDKELKIEIE